MNELIITKPHQLEELVTRAVKKAVEDKIKSLPDKPNKKEIFSSRQAMEFLNVSRSTLHRWRESGLLPYRKVENTILYKKEDLDRLLEENRK